MVAKHSCNYAGSMYEQGFIAATNMNLAGLRPMSILRTNTAMEPSPLTVYLDKSIMIMREAWAHNGRKFNFNQYYQMLFLLE